MLQGPIGGEVLKVFFLATGLRNTGIECSSRSCALVGEGAAKAVDFAGDGHPARTCGDSIVYVVSGFVQEAVLGVSLLGQRLLRGLSHTRRMRP